MYPATEASPTIWPQEAWGGMIPTPTYEREASVKIAVGIPKGRGDDQGRQGIRHHVSTDDPSGTSTRDASRADVLGLAQGQELRAEQPGFRDPADQADGDEDVLEARARTGSGRS